MKRIAAAPLWFMVGWFIGSMTAWILGFGPFLAPIVAVALASLVVADPRHVIWDREAALDTKRVAQRITRADAHTV
jgi:hypothetical protein